MGDTKLAKTAAEQDAIRRAAKARRGRSAKKYSFATETLSEGLISDQASKMSELLELTMVSSSPSVERTLQMVHACYIAEFTLAKAAETAWYRHRRALDVTMRKVRHEPVSLQKYCKSRLVQVYETTKRR